MTDYDDYENNLAFKPIGDWADTEPKTNTDRTQSSLDLVDKIKELTEENAMLKEMLEECRENITDSWDSFIDIAAGGETAELIKKINEVIDEKEQTDD